MVTVGDSAWSVTCLMVTAVDSDWNVTCFDGHRGRQWLECDLLDGHCGRQWWNVTCLLVTVGDSDGMWLAWRSLLKTETGMLLLQWSLWKTATGTWLLWQSLWEKVALLLQSHRWKPKERALSDYPFPAASVTGFPFHFRYCCIFLSCEAHLPRSPLRWNSQWCHPPTLFCGT